MPPPRFILKQLERPSGLLGRLVLRRLNAANSAMNATPLAEIPVAESDRVLEIGFGGGALLGMILQAGPRSVVGVDTSNLAVDKVRSRHLHEIDKGMLELVNADASSLPFEDGEFSKVYCVNVIYFWDYLAPVLKEIARVTSVPGHLALCYQEYGPDESRRFAPREIERALVDAGFATTETATARDKANGEFYCTIAGKASGMMP